MIKKIYYLFIFFISFSIFSAKSKKSQKKDKLIEQVGNQFFPAVMAGDKRVLENLFKDHPEIATRVNKNSTDVNGHTLLMYCIRVAAVKKEFLELAQLLIDKGADIEFTAPNSITPLKLALNGENLDVIKLLIKNNVNLEYKFEHGYTALIIESGLCRKDIVKLLLDSGAKIEACDINGDTPLIHAAGNGKIDIVELLLQRGAQIEAKNTEGETALTLACRNGRMDCVSFLLEKKANIETQNKKGLTPLMWACRNGRSEIADLLLKNKADVECQVQVPFPETPLTMSGAYPDVVKVLLNHNAKIDTKHTFAATPLHLYCHNNQIQSVEHLLNNKADINVQDGKGNTPLHIAAYNGHSQLCVYLLNKSANFSLKNNFGNTPFHDALVKGHIDIAKLIFNYIQLKQELINVFVSFSESGRLDQVKLMLDKDPSIIEEFNSDYKLAINVTSDKEIQDYLKKNNQNLLRTYNIDLLHECHELLSKYDESLKICKKCSISLPLGTHENKPLLTCGKCKKTYYCSKECQKAHWPDHKKSCNQQSNQENSQQDIDPAELVRQRIVALSLQKAKQEQAREQSQAAKPVGDSEEKELDLEFVAKKPEKPKPAKTNKSQRRSHTPTTLQAQDSSGMSAEVAQIHAEQLKKEQERQAEIARLKLQIKIAVETNDIVLLKNLRSNGVELSREARTLLHDHEQEVKASERKYARDNYSGTKIKIEKSKPKKPKGQKSQAKNSGNKKPKSQLKLELGKREKTQPDLPPTDSLSAAERILFAQTKSRAVSELLATQSESESSESEHEDGGESKVITIPYGDTEIKINLDHIIKGFAGFDGKYHGLHLDLGGYLLKSGRIKQIGKEDASGCFIAQIEDKDLLKDLCQDGVFNKSFFPITWSIEDLQEAITEAIEHVDPKQISHDGKDIVLVGIRQPKVGENALGAVNIKIVLTKCADGSTVIKTAYPIIEKI